MHKYVTWTWLVFIWWTVLVGTFDAIQLSLCDKIFSSSWLNPINGVICCIYLQLKASFRFMSQIPMQLDFHQISARFTKNESDRSLMNFTKIQLGVSTTDVEFAIKRSEVDMDTLRETMVDKKWPGKWMAGIWPRKKPVMAAGEGCAQCPPR